MKTWFAFLGAAVAWSVQLILGYALLSHTCYPQGEPLLSPTQGGFSVAAVIVEIVTLLVALAALGMAWRLVGLTIGRPVGFSEAAAISDDDGVPRYLAVAGVLIGIVFTLLIVFNGLALILEPTCRFS
jgi:hypothetical protein